MKTALTQTLAACAATILAISSIGAIVTIPPATAQISTLELA